MREFFLIPIVYVAALLEIWLAPRWDVRGVTPDLLALVAFAWLAGTRSRYAFFSAALVGLASDLSSSAPLGVGMAAFATVAYFVMYLRRNLHMEGTVARMLIVGFAATTVCALQGIALRLLQHLDVSLNRIIEQAALVGLYTAAVAVPLVLMVHWMKPKREPTTVAISTA